MVSTMSVSKTDTAKFLDELENLLDNDLYTENAKLQSLATRIAASIDDGDLTTVEAAFKALGTAVGAEKKWQEPYRECGILALAMQQLLEIETSPVNKQCLRVIGNCVADNDINREIVTKDLQKLLACLSVEDLATTTFIVLFNLCNGFDPAQAAIATLRLDSVIAAGLAVDSIDEAALDYVVDLLTWTTEKITAEQLKDLDSAGVFRNLVKVALQYDEDHYHEYIAIIVHYLQDPEFQNMVATPDILDDLFTLMLDFEERTTPEEIEDVFKELSINKNDETRNSADTTVILLSQLVSSISAISATDAFAQTSDVTSQIVEKIRVKLRAPTESPSLVCAYVILGNLAMSDEVCTNMVNVMEIHKPLMSILSTSVHPAVLYAAAGLMRHLTFPEANRAFLVDAGLLQTCCHMLSLGEPSVRGEAAAILAKLVTGNFHNIEQLVYQTFSPPNTSDIASTTIIAYVVEQALAPSGSLPSTAMKNPMIELGRTIVTMLRHLGRPNAEKDVDEVRQQMLAVPKIARPVARIVRQRFYPDARSEGLLGLGLMAQVPEGALRVVEELQEDSGMFEAVKELAVGSDAQSQQQGSASGRDYQNAMVLLQALQNNADLPASNVKDQVAALQDELGKLMT